ncbi:hypothetical protein N2152v2_000047 [Parachlorella kessleri]
MSCCYDLWACPEVAASAQLWGSLEARFGATPRRTAAEPSIIYVLSDDELEVEPEEEDSDSEPEPLFSRGGAALQQWSLGGWLTRRKLGVRRLHLRFGRCTSVALPALLGALEGSRLEDLRISFPPGGPSSRQRGSGSSGRGSPSSTSSTRSRGRRVGHSPTPAHWDLVRHLVCLTRLELPWCGLTSLPAGLSALTGLCELDVSFNAALGRASAGALRPLRHLSQLTRLDLSECKLPQRLPLLPELRELHLRSACLRGREGPSLTLDHHSRLTYLCLNNCGLAQLPPGLSALGGTLAELDLNWNTDLLEAEAGGGGTMSLLGHLSALTCLELARCSLRRVPPSLASLTSLARLNLNGNGALGSGGGSSAAFEPLRSLAGSLTSLQMYECGLQRVPAQLAGLSRLAQLSLASNDMLGCQDDGGPVFAALQSLAALTWLRQVCGRELLRGGAQVTHPASWAAVGLGS